MSLRGYGVIIAAFLTVFIACVVRYGYGMLLPGVLVSLLHLLGRYRLRLIRCSYMFISFTVLVLFTFLGVYASEELRLFSVAASMDFFPKSVAGSVIWLWTFFLGDGSIISPIICGWSIDISGSYTWAFNIEIFAAMLSVALLLPLLKQSGRAVDKYEYGIPSDFLV